VATEHTSLYNLWHQRKADFGLADLFQVQAPPWRVVRGSRPEAVLSTSPVRNRIGDGRVVYLAEIIPSVEKPPAEAMRSRYWKLPANLDAMMESVKWAAGQDLSIDVSAPAAVAMEMTEKLNKRHLMLHLVNYAAERTAVQNIEVNLKIPVGKTVQQVRIVSPDSDGMIAGHQASDNGIMFRVPELQTYNLVIIDFM
jgi:hypothetical protein